MGKRVACQGGAMSHFLQWANMGGYSMYVWPAYGLVGVVFGFNALFLFYQRKVTRKKLQQWFKRQES